MNKSIVISKLNPFEFSPDYIFNLANFLPVHSRRFLFSSLLLLVVVWLLLITSVVVFGCLVLALQGVQRFGRLQMMVFIRSQLILVKFWLECTIF